MVTGSKVDSGIENLFELLSIAKPIRVLVRTDKFLDPIELLGSKSDSGNMKRHRIGPAFSENSTVCTRGFSRRFAVFRRSRREKPLASRVGQQPPFWICNEAGRGSKSPRGDGERCVTPARAAAKETRIENAKMAKDRCCSPRG